MALEPVGGGSPEDTAFTPISTEHTQRVNNNGTTTPIVNITAQSKMYGVQFTFTMLESTWQIDGGPPETGLKTSQVNAICGYDHVVGFYTQADTGADLILYNYAHIVVGNDLNGVTDEAVVRMDHIGEQSTFAAIDKSWQRVQAMGVS